MHHENKREFDCKECGKSFNTRSNLNQHMRVHAQHGRKPFQCEVCEKSYMYRDTLKFHLKTKHRP